MRLKDRVELDMSARAVSISVCAVFAGFVGTAAAQNAVFDSYIKSAEKSSEKGDILGAEKFLLLAEKEAEGDEPKLIQVWHRLALTKDRLFNYGDAEAHYQKALSRVEKRNKGKKDDRNLLAHSQTLFANHYRMRGRYDEAEALYKKSLAIRERVNGPKAWETAQLMRDLADNHRDAGRYDAAEPIYRSAIAMLDGQKGREYHLAFCLANLGELMLLQDRLEEAGALAQQAMNIYREQNLNVPHNRVFCAATLGEVQARQKKIADAEKTFTAGLKDLESTGPAGIRVVPFLKRAAKFYRDNGRTAEAKKLEESAKSIEEKHAKANETKGV
jgi:tetratricopeptide (TPR) repeat protein